MHRPGKLYSIKNSVLEHKVDIFHIEEVKMSITNFEQLLAYIWSRDSFAFSEVASTLRGIATISDPNKISCRTIFSIPHFLVVDFVENNFTWMLFNFYTPNMRARRLQIWEESSLVIGASNAKNLICVGKNCRMEIKLLI